MNKLRYTLVRVYHKVTEFGNRLSTEELDCKTLNEAIELGECLSIEEKCLGSYIFDNVRNKKLTLKGKE